MHQFLKFTFGIKLYMFRTVPLAIIRIFHCTHSNSICHTGYSYSLRARSGRKLSANLYDIYHCCVYSEKTSDD